MKNSGTPKSSRASTPPVQPCRIWPVLNAAWVVTTISAPAARTAFRVGNVRSRVGVTACAAAVLVLVIVLVLPAPAHAGLVPSCRSRSRGRDQAADGHVRRTQLRVAHQVP